MKFFKISSVVLSTLLAGHSVAADSIKVSLLKDNRALMKFPEYTIEQKSVLLNQVTMTLAQIFVHRELKLKDFGPSSDPLYPLHQIDLQINTISDYDFHKRMSEIFSKLRDFHTSYSMPLPYGCYTNIIPVSLKEITDSTGAKSVVISRVTEREEYLKFMPPNFAVKKGDQVISYNGIPVKQVMKSLEGESAGANPGAVTRHTAMMLTYVSQLQNVAPATDEVVMVLKNSAGQTYSVTIPWISVASSACLGEEKNSTINGRSETSANLDQIEFNKIFRRSINEKSASDGDGLKSTIEPTLKYKKITNEHGTYGYFKLESFVPEAVSPEGVVLEFKKLLQTEFLNTTGIIIDLRDNGGGIIEIADKLTQLFTANDVTPTNFRLKNSPANLHFLTTVDPTGSDKFTRALVEANTSGATYTKPLPLRETPTVNTIGQYFFRPVAILTNANCYSSCDMFSAQMQDHGAAVIYGEDGSTGAGGANNYNFNAVYNSLPELKKGPFKKLPGKQDIGFSYRQSLRTGLRNGQLLEDVGVVSDKVVAPTLADITNFSDYQLTTISSDLKNKAGAFKSWVTLNNDGRIEMAPGSRPDVFAKWAFTNSIEFRRDGKVIGRSDVEENNVAGRLIAVPDSLISSAYSSNTFEMSGFQNGKKIWKKVINYRVIPSFGEVPVSGLKLDLSSGFPEYFKVYNTDTESTDGWNVHNGVLRLGTAEKYAASVRSSASVFLNLPAQKNTLSFNAEIDTEADYDFFRVTIISEGKETILMPYVSGKVESKDYSYDLSAYAGKNVEIVFGFTSDDNENARGVFLQNISISN